MFPPDDTLEVTAAVSGGRQGVTRWYTCSKGHKYGIGDCGQPVGRGRCPDCGEPIGAGRANYAFADGRNAQQVRGAVHPDIKTFVTLNSCDWYIGKWDSFNCKL